MIGRRNVWQSQYYKILRKYMTIAGVWPYDPIRQRCLILSLNLIFMLSMFPPEILYLLNISISTEDLFDCVPEILITILTIFKLMNLLINNKKVKACFKAIKEDWLSLSTDVEKAILRRQAVYVQHITMFYGVLMWSTFFFYILIPLISAILSSGISNATTSSRSKASQLPYHAEYGDKLDQHFYPIMIFCYLTALSLINVVIATDSFFFVLIQHACGMFAIVGHALEDIGKDSDDNFSFQPDKMKDDNYKLALNCLRRHLKIIHFTTLIESTFSNLLLASANLNMISCSLVGIQIITNTGNVMDIIAPMSLYIGHLLHLYLYFWQAQVLQDYSVIPYESILRGKWYYTSSRCRKILLLIMKRAMSPCKLTAGKIIILSIESFGTVLKTSLSYFTILRSLQ